jgi:hypothetical protein
LSVLEKEDEVVLTGGVHTPEREREREREREGEGNISEERLVGPRAASVAGLDWSPATFSIFFVFLSFFFSVFF